MKKEEILMGLAVSLLCMGASSFVVRSQAGSPGLYQQAYSAKSDLSSQVPIESLPDGNYRFCSEAAPNNGGESGMCFRFQKMGDRAVGSYQSANTPQTSVCIVGRINRNTVNGEAIDFSSPTSEPLQLRPELQGGELVSWDATGTVNYLKVASGQALDQNKSKGAATIQPAVQPTDQPTGSIRFRQASLDLSNFYKYSSGTIEPPTGCSN